MREQGTEPTPTLSRLLADYRSRDLECKVCLIEPLFWRDEYETGACRDCLSEVMRSVAE